ncbi:MAG TPA: OsmC family protein [Ignavibacteriaceae bacterium]|nr:OsmC family protein [Ignavibacteriaceae bacterium]
MEDVLHYSVSINWDEGRIGTLSAEGLKDLQGATPPEFSKGVPGYWSPEHLYVASVTTCLMTTFLAIAENSNLEFVDYKADAKSTLEKVDGKFQVTQIDITPIIKIKNEKDKERALRILEKSEKGCLISNSIKTKVNLNPEILIEE